MRDEVRLENIVKFCEEPRKAKEIMEKFSMSENVAYKCIRYLRADGYLKKIQDFSKKNYVGATYQTTEKKFVREGSEGYVTGVTICGVRF
jgi:transposase